MSNIFSPLKSYYRLWDKVENYGTAGQATDDNIVGYRFIVHCILKAAYTNSKYELLISLRW